MSEWPLCACGCGDTVAAHKTTGKPRKYATYLCRNRLGWQQVKKDPERHRRWLDRIESSRRERNEWLKRVNPQEYRRLLDAHNERQRSYRERHPEDVRATRRRYMDRVMADPERRAEIRERARIRRRLQKEREGIPLEAQRKPTPKYRARRDIRRLPAAPLGAWIASLINEPSFPDGLGHLREKRTKEDVSATLGITSKSFNEWRDGRRKEVQFDVVDRILTKTGVLWFEVYDPDVWPEEYEKARAVFEPEDLAA